MRGSPLLNALLAFVAIALLGFPVHRLTQAAVVIAPAAPAAPAAGALQQVSVALAFTAEPKSVRLRHLGKVVWSAEAPGLRADAEFAVPWPGEGIDLLVEIAWPDEAPLSAARLVLTDPDNDEQTRSVWGRGTASEVLTFR